MDDRATRDRELLMQHDIDPDDASLEELARVLVDNHSDEHGLLGAVARKADLKLQELGE